jgi:hypothetical protein
MALAQLLDQPLALVEALTRDDLQACIDLTDAQLSTYVLLLADTAERQAGRVPVADTAVIHCRACGLVFVHPSIAAVLPVIDGWPRALGCPWCFIRKAGGAIPHPKVMCGACRHFITNPINPTAGLGGCTHGLGAHYPMQAHVCSAMTVTTKGGSRDG